MLHPQEISHFLLEGLDHRPQDESLAFQDLLDCLIDLGPDSGILPI
jgi:hypothetical protein